MFITGDSCLLQVLDHGMANIQGILNAFHAQAPLFNIGQAKKIGFSPSGYNQEIIVNDPFIG